MCVGCCVVCAAFNEVHQWTSTLDRIDHDRRRFLGAAVMTITAFELAAGAPARAASPATSPGKGPATNATQTSFDPLKQIDAGVLNVGYAEVGPANGAPVILLHGWPYDIHTYADVAPLLAAKGHRVIVPYLRGYGTTRFLSDETMRNGQQSAVAADVIALMDALRIESATIAGCDWGARTANIVAALWPERCKAMVSVSGYLIGNQQAGRQPLPPKAELQWWYQYYFATDRGRAGYEKYTARFRQADLAARFAAVELRRRHIRAERGRLRQSRSRRDRDPQLPLAARVWPKASRSTTIWRSGWRRRPSSPCPTITLEGDANGAPHPEASAYAKMFSGKYAAPGDHRRHRPQPAAGSAGGLCTGHSRPRDSLGVR